MTRIKQYIFSILLISLLINTAYGFAGMNTGNSTVQTDLANTTESDQDIQLLFHLIELDAVQLQSTNKLLVRETIVFKNAGAMNFSGPLRTWVQDGAEGLIIEKRDMSTGELIESFPVIQNGNIISWRDSIQKNNPMSPLYFVGYTLPAEPKGTIIKTKYYSKMFIYPTLITKQPNMLVLKVNRNQDETISITDENGNKISSAGNPEEGRYEWETPDFKEVNIEISKPAFTFAGIAGYLVLGLVIILVISYPFLRKKSEKIQAIEEKIRNSLKREETEESYEEAPEETVEDVEEAAEDTTSGVPAEAGDAELDGKTREELENLRTETLSKLAELDKDYESGTLMDEEYEELRKPYQEKADRINKKIEQSV